MDNNKNQMSVQDFMRVLKFSMIGIGKELRKMQENIMLDERFGKDAVDYPSLYNPTRRREDVDSGRIKRHDELLEFGKKVQEILNRVEKVDMEMWAEGISEYFKSKK